MTAKTLDQLQARLAQDPVLKAELESALAQGGLAAAADVAARRGLIAGGAELSDLELEFVSAGKVVGPVGPGWGWGWGGWGWGVARVGRVGFWF